MGVQKREARSGGWWRIASAAGIGAAIAVFGALKVQDVWRQRFAPGDLGDALAPGETPGPENFLPMDVMPPPRPLKGFDVVDAAAADDVLDDEELVLGVEVAGESRAYPINMLTGPEREIVNDELGGRSIAATW